MKNFKYLLILSLFLVFFWSSAVHADLASTKSFYVDRIQNKYTPSLASSFYGRIEDMEYINFEAINSLLSSFGSELTSLESSIQASSTEQEILDLMNTTGSSLDLTFMILGDSALSYIQANGLASQIQNSYQLINDTRTFVANYTTGPEYTFFQNKRKLVFDWPNLSSFISPALAAEVPTTGWTCRKYDQTDPELCGSQLNLQGQPCFFSEENGLCVGDPELGLAMAAADGNEEQCIVEFCAPEGLKDCYQGGKCAANGLLEEYVGGAAPEEPGTCGNANGMTFSYDATGYSPYLQCATGSSTNTNFPVQGGTENWLCQTSGGDSSQCSASRENPPVGACGDAHERVFPYDATGYPPYEQCSVGTPSKTDFPEQGQSLDWTCSAAGGDSPVCTASREENPETAVCGDGVVEGEEECDDNNEVDGTTGDFCYNDCTKRYLDTGDTSELDTSLALLDTYEADPENSLDTNVAQIDAILIDIYNVYGLTEVSENEKLALLRTYQQSLDSLYTDTQTLINGIVVEVENILSL
ncbi:hypothetical protein K9K85_01690 [Patescibacteria group bacterium]|nr:hypothetical protein [Patescibacteria group bacterium]